MNPLRGNHSDKADIDVQMDVRGTKVSGGSLLDRLVANGFHTPSSSAVKLASSKTPAKSVNTSQRMTSLSPSSIMRDDSVTHGGKSPGKIFATNATGTTSQQVGGII